MRNYNNVSRIKTWFSTTGTKFSNPQVVERELLWQNSSLKENQPLRVKFLDNAQQLQHFCSFAPIRENSAYATLVYSIGQYFSDAGNCHGGLWEKYIGFIGDKTSQWSPTKIIVPDTVGEWKIPLVVVDMEVLTDYYTDDGNNRTLFMASTPGDIKKNGKKKSDKSEPDVKMREVAIPHMLALPHFIAVYLCAQPHITPFDILFCVSEKMKEFDIQVNLTSWMILHDWCMATTQPTHPTPPTNSHVNVKIDADTTYDDSFCSWVAACLNTTIGIPKLDSHAPTSTLPMSFHPDNISST